MADCTDKKRVRDEFDDSLVESPQSKRRRVDSSESATVDTCAENNCNDGSPESECAVIDFPAAAEIQDDLLHILEDSDAGVERDEAIPELQLDSFIRSFEEEIQAMPPVQPPNESQPELGFLFEASDDELGLPPTVGSNGEETIGAVDFAASASSSSSGTLKFEGNLGFEEDIPCFDSFEIGFGIDSGGISTTEENEFALGGLFDYSDVPFRPESLSAL